MRLAYTSGVAWYEQAACRTAPTSLFFAAEREKPLDRKDREKLAKAICAECVVSAECFAAGEGEFGIWGGLNETERAQNRRKKRLTRPVKTNGDDANPWIQIDGFDTVQIWQRNNDQNWHGTEWAVAKNAEVLLISDSLEGAYIFFHHTLG